MVGGIVFHKHNFWFLYIFIVYKLYQSAVIVVHIKTGPILCIHKSKQYLVDSCQILEYLVFG